MVLKMFKLVKMATRGNKACKFWETSFTINGCNYYVYHFMMFAYYTCLKVFYLPSLSLIIKVKKSTSYYIQFKLIIAVICTHLLLEIQRYELKISKKNC